MGSWYTLDRKESLMKQKTVQDEIFEKSQELFRQKSYDAVTIDEICAAVGISKPTFYAKKLTKRILLLQAYQVCASPTLEETDILASITALIDQVVQTMFRYGPNLFADFLKEHLKNPAFDLLLVSDWTTRLTHLIEEGQRKGFILNQENPIALVNLIQVYLLGYGFQYALGRTRDTEKHLHTSIALILLANPLPSSTLSEPNSSFSLEKDSSISEKRNSLIRREKLMES